MRRTPKDFQKKRRQRAQRKGALSEIFSAFFLCFKGYRILARRYRTPLGEIDLIATKNNTLVMIEVKARATFYQGFEAVTNAQQQRIERASKIFLAKHPKLSGHWVRFDIMLVSSWRWKHLKNAWSPRF